MPLVERLKSAVIGTRLQTVLSKLEWLRRDDPIAHRDTECMEAVSRCLLTETSNCVDVGAHLGSFLARIVSLAPAGHHYAFEPIPEKATRLARKFPAVRVLPLALADEVGDSQFWHVTKSSAMSGIHVMDHLEGQASKISVRKSRLDDVLPDDYRVDLIKVDVEGGEFEFFRGASRVLSTQRPFVFFECQANRLQLYGHTPQDVFDVLTGEFGLRVFLVHEWLDGKGGLTRDQFGAATRAPVAAYNFLAGPSSRPETGR